MSDKNLLAELVRKSQSGDSAALNQLFNSCYNDIYYFALKTVKNEEAAYDITQESCIEIIKSISSLTNPEAFTTWSKQITYRRCTRYFDKNREVLVDENEDGSDMFDALEDDDRDFIPDEALDKEDFRLTIMNMINGLSEEQRTAVMLYYFDELSVGEIAQIQGVSEGTVKSRLNYARKSIKSAVEDYEEKNGVKLHSFGLLPLLLWLRGGDLAGLSIPTAGAALRGALGSGLAASAIGSSASAIGTAATSTVATAATATASKSIAIKIIAAIAAVTVAIGGGAAAYKVLSEKTKEKEITTTENTTEAAVVIPDDFTSDMLVPYSYQHDFKSDFYKCLDSGAQYFITKNGEVYDLISTSDPQYTDVPIDNAYYLSNYISYVNDDGSVVLNFCDSIWTIAPVKGEIIGFTFIGYSYAEVISYENNVYYYTKYDLTTGDSVNGPYQVVLKTADGETADIARLDICYSLSMGFSGFYITSGSSSYFATKRYVTEDSNPRFIMEATPYCENVDRHLASDDQVTMKSPIYSKTGDSTTLYYYNNGAVMLGENAVPLPEGYTVSQINQLIPTETYWLFIFDDGAVYVMDITSLQSHEVEHLSQLNRDGMILNFYIRKTGQIFVLMADNGLYEYKEKK